MELRAPAYPLFTVDPYFSIWSPADRLFDADPIVWFGEPYFLYGVAEIDGTPYRFLGKGGEFRPNDSMRQYPAMEQTDVEVTTFETVYRFCAGGVALTATFTSPLLPDDLTLVSRPTSYLHLAQESVDGKAHRVQVTFVVSQDVCSGPKKLRCVADCAPAEIGAGIAAMRMGSTEQPVLGQSGDRIGIDWGYFYLAVQGGEVELRDLCGRSALCATADLTKKGDALLVLAYDDLYSLRYFGEFLRAYWKQDGTTIEQAIAAAFAEYPALRARCADFHANLTRDAQAVGGSRYAELLALSTRQIMAGHKLVVDPAGELLFISKECMSNGCAATVDVSYPSFPFFLLYNPVLAEAIVRPILDYADSDRWPLPFAPHDLGTYPILNGQVYSRGTMLYAQMPVEECGNMLVMVSALAAVGKDDLAKAHPALLAQWADYLRENGADPAEQLCTDDFAGHLAHNCNLSLKAIVALGGYGRVCERLGQVERGKAYCAAAADMAETWKQNAAEPDGSFRLTFDKPGAFSMKYNAVWDRLFGLGLFPDPMWRAEVAGYDRQLRPYGLPLDSRADYTKSDWMLWTATLANDDGFFRRMVDALWRAYHYSTSRVPMTDWFSTVTALQISFQHRTVQGGLFIRLLLESGKCRL